MSVVVEHLHRRFGMAAALHDVALVVERGEFVALLGPSGSGKTTLLRILAGLDRADAGTVRIDGQDMTDVPARGRRIGFVFQHYALFRHMSVFENVAFGLRVRPRPPAEAEISRRVMALLERVQIADLAKRRPDQISGGQRQRAALARALAIEPKLLLLDEPFGALDAEVRKGLRRWLRDLHRELGLTSIFVTHDQEEAMELADRVAVMRAGRIAQYDTPEVLMESPADSFIAGFLGETSRLQAEWDGARLHFTASPLPPLSAPSLRRHPGRPGAAWAFVRPHDWAVEAAGEEGNAVLRARHPVAQGIRLELALGGEVVEAELPTTSLQPGDRCQLRVLAARAYEAG
ncbi:sulfate ABC transporter, ATP-binding protein [Acetobacteraceae bacterium AT-5844]|nr:sulfate ABC transporter, ATP-binding protein [Acetobacteraceae bacterium AT-5844]